MIYRINLTNNEQMREMNSINLSLCELDEATKSNSVSADNSSKENVKMAEKTRELAAMMKKEDRIKNRCSSGLAIPL